MRFTAAQLFERKQAGRPLTREKLLAHVYGAPGVRDAVARLSQSGVKLSLDSLSPDLLRVGQASGVFAHFQELIPGEFREEDEAKTALAIAKALIEFHKSQR